MKQFQVHFEGFYESTHSHEIDDQLELYFSDENGEPQDQPDNIDYQKIFLAYSQLYLKAFNEHLNDEYGLEIEMAFKGLDSPKFYNFQTDVILSEISDSDFNKIKIKFLTIKMFVDFVNETSKSRDGFASFYDGIEAVAADDEILLTYISKYVIAMDEELEIHDLLRDTYYSYEMLYNMDFLTEEA